MRGAYRRDLLQDEQSSEASSSQFPISVEPLSHSESVGLEQDFRNVTK